MAQSRLYVYASSDSPLYQCAYKMVMGRALVAVLLFVLLTRVTVEGQGMPAPCLHQYTKVPSTKYKVEYCNILGSLVRLACGVTGQANDTLNVHWYRETERSMAGSINVQPLTNGEHGYQIETRITSNVNFSHIFSSSLLISSVSRNDLAYFWCRAEVNGVIQPRASDTILISIPCDPSTNSCLASGANLFIVTSNQICADEGEAPEPPHPPVCATQTVPAPTTPTDSVSTPTITHGHSVDIAPMVSPTKDGPQSDRSQIWRYFVAGIAGAIGTIIFTLVSVIIVFGVRVWRRKREPTPPLQPCSAYGREPGGERGGRSPLSMQQCLAYPGGERGGRSPLSMQPCSAYGREPEGERGERRHSSLQFCAAYGIALEEERRAASAAATNYDSTGEVFYDTIPDVIQEDISHGGEGYETLPDADGGGNSHRESAEEEEYESVIDDDSGSYSCL